MKKRAITLLKLEAKAWNVFSKYIRLNYADSQGYVTCVTCGKRLHWKDADAGHFVKRGNKLVKFDECNVHPQCSADNVYQGGRQDDYAAFIIKTYGIDTFNRLIEAKGKVCKRTRWQFEEIIEYYQDKLKELNER